MDTEGNEIVGGRFGGQELLHSACEFWRNSMNAKGHELIGILRAIAGVGHVLYELAGDVVHGEAEKLLIRESRIAEGFHALDVVAVRCEGEFTVAFAAVEAAVKADGSGIAAHFEMDLRVFRGGQAGVEAGEVAELVRVAPAAVVAPTGAIEFELEAGALGRGG